MRKRTSAFVALGLALVGSPSSAHAIRLWAETLDGELSADRFHPTEFVGLPGIPGPLTAGVHVVHGTTNPNEHDYFTLALAPGVRLESIIAQGFSAEENAIFIAVQEGDAFTEPPSGVNLANVLGYAYFGTTGPDAVRANILDDMGTAAGAMGFTPPLDGGTTYVFWLVAGAFRSGGSGYALDFHVVPEPSTGVFSVCLAVGFAGTRPRKPCA